ATRHQAWADGRRYGPRPRDAAEEAGDRCRGAARSRSRRGVLKEQGMETTGREPSSPYLAARQEWLERYGDYIAQARAWRITAVLALIVAALACGGLVMLMRQSRVVPYVVKVDRLGAALAVERADEAARPDAAIIKAQLARWAMAVRSVYVDAAA